MGILRAFLIFLSVLVGIAVGIFAFFFVLFSIGCAGPSDAGYDEHLAWSPDGRKFAYVQWDTYGNNCKSTIWVEDADSGEKVKLTDSGRSPSWSPDSKRIAFVLFQGSRSGIALMDADGSHVKPLRLGPSLGCNWSRRVGPNWSPDGRLIAFSTQTDADGGRSLGISTIHTDGTGLRRITAGDDYLPDWSPDSKRLVFSHQEPGEFGRYTGVIVNADGTGRRTIEGPMNGSYALEYAWSPDGKWIVGDDLIPVSGGATRELYFPCGYCSNFAWSPDGTRVARLTESGKIVVRNLPTVSKSPLRYHYTLALGGSALPAGEIAVGYGTDLYLSSPDLPEDTQVHFTFKLCAALQHGERCRTLEETLNSGETITNGWTMARDENVDRVFRLSVRIRGREVAHETLRVVTP